MDFLAVFFIGVIFSLALTSTPVPESSCLPDVNNAYDQCEDLKRQLDLKRV